MPFSDEIRIEEEERKTEMILNSAAAAAAIPLRPLLNPIRASSNVSTEKLRQELSHLHSEADSTRTKANSARLRLLRLSEAAEKLRRQAAVSVRTGKEDDARDLLFQKKKVMQALEKSKSRIKLFDELSAKLNEAIYVKENQLIGSIDSDLTVTAEEDSSPVRIATSEQEAAEDSEETDILTEDVKLPEYQDLQPSGEDHASLANDKEQGALSCSGIESEDEILKSVTGTSSYEDFMEKLDQQLNIIEDELDTVLKASTVLLDDENKQKNLRVQQIMELQYSIRLIRKRLEQSCESRLGVSKACFLGDLTFETHEISSFKLANANIR